MNSLQNSLYALDLETACAVKSCSGICKHALYPHTSRITILSVWNDSFHKAFWDLSDFAIWLSQHPNAVFVGHNFQFDLKHLQYRGINLGHEQWAFDTLLMAAIQQKKIPDNWLSEYELERKQLNKDLPRGKRHRPAKGLSLKTLAPYFLNVPKFWEATQDHADAEYVLKDTEYTWRLFKLFRQTLVKENSFQFLQKYQMPWARAMFQLGGVELDLAGMLKLEKETTEKVVVLKQQLETLWHYGSEARYSILRQRVTDKYDAQLAKSELKTKKGRHAALYERINQRCAWATYNIPRKINIDSSAQMLWLFKEFYKWNVKSLDGTTSAGKTLLQKMADEGHEDAQLFLQYKSAKKLLTSFIEPYKQLQVNGKLYPTFNSFGARTGRTSCNGPNLQQCPPSIRRLIRAPIGYKLIIKDMSAIEPRLIAYFSEDEKLVKLFQEPHADFHGLTTTLYELVPAGTHWSEVKKKYPKERDAGKEGGLSNLYGGGAVRLKLSLQKRGIMVSEDQCRGYIKNLRSGYSGVTKYKKQLDKQAELGPIKSIFGMPVSYPIKDDIYMKAFNTQIQGSASQLVVEAVKRLQEQFKQLGMKSRVVLAVHDEIVTLSPDEEVIEAEKLVIKTMTSYTLKTKYGLVPLEVEGKISQAWEK